MKNAVIIVLVIVGSFECIFGQSSGIKKANDRELSEQIIQGVNARVQLLLEQGKVKEASLYIAQNEGKCKALVDGKFCKAGLDFTQAYLFQQAATKNDVNSKAYARKAGSYYEKVLKRYPNNKVAWSNLLQLYTKTNTTAEAIEQLKELTGRIPNKKARVLVEMGNLYRESKELKKACKAYSEAYSADPFLVEAYEAIVDLYTTYDFRCALGDIYDIREVARVCEEINLSNRAEEVLQKELMDHIKAKKYLKAKESLLLWADVLLNNNWINDRDMNSLRNKVAAINKDNSKEINEIDEILCTMGDMFKSKDVQDFPSLKYWSTLNANVRVPKQKQYVSPQSIFLKILLMKGKNAERKKKYGQAEGYWQKAWSMSSKDDLENYLEVALNLAQLYNRHPKLDSKDKKFNAVIVELFEGKGTAYKNQELPVIRKYHIVLGSIFYNRKQWDEKASHINAAANARFQLERALHSRFGPIVNPKLQQMLGDVYQELKQNDRAFEAYSNSVQDYLALDLVRDASKLHKTISANASSKNEYNLLGKIIALRKKAKNENSMGTMSSSDVTKYIKEVSKIEKEASTTFSKEFVNLQVFKTFTDSGSQLENNRNSDRQILHSEALSRIQNTNKLASPNDYKRIKTIRNSLEKSVENPQNLDRTRVYNKADLQHANNTWKSKVKTKTYTLGNGKKEILVPQQLFDLNNVIKKDYKLNVNKHSIPNIQLKDRKFQQRIKQ